MNGDYLTVIQIIWATLVFCPTQDYFSPFKLSKIVLGFRQTCSHKDKKWDGLPRPQTANQICKSPAKLRASTNISIMSSIIFNAAFPQWFMNEYISKLETKIVRKVQMCIKESHVLYLYSSGRDSLSMQMGLLLSLNSWVKREQPPCL